MAGSGGICTSLEHAVLRLAAGFAPCTAPWGTVAWGSSCAGALALPADEWGLINGERRKVKRFP